MFDRLGGLVGLVDVVCLFVCERFLGWGFVNLVR